MSSAPPPCPPEIARLLHKYEVLASLRAARARGEPIPERAVFKALAAELPGALYELDRLPIEDIESRRAALADVASGAAPVAPWMTAMATYHALYRAALHVKARSRKHHTPGPEEAAALAASASRHAGVPVASSFVIAVTLPERGRIGPVVLAEVAARTGQTPSATLAALFPTRRDFSPTGDDDPEQPR